jgi:hypothetical protein
MKTQKTQLRTRRRLVGLAGLAVVVTACGTDGSDGGTGGQLATEGTNTGNGVVSLSLNALTPEGTPAEGALPVADADGAALSLTRARAAVREVRLQLPDGLRCDALAADAISPPWVCEAGDDWVRLRTGFVVDLLDPSPPAALTEAELPALDWRRAEVRFQDGGDFAGAGDPLQDLTIDAAGTFEYQGQARRFTLGLDFSADARFDSAGSLELPADAASGLLLGLDAAAWFATLPLTACLDDGDLEFSGDVVEVTDGKNGCSDLEGALKDAIEGSGSLRRRED